MLTTKQRETLEGQLCAFNGAEQNIRTAMEPMRIALEAVNAARSLALEAHGVELCGYCECGKPLLTGDKAHHCMDGELLCEECAPTWAELQAQSEEPDADTGRRKMVADYLDAWLKSGGDITDKVVSMLAEGF